MIESAIKLEIEVPGGRYLVIAVPLDPKEPVQFDRPWKAAFLKWLSRGLSVNRASELAGVSRTHPYRCRQADKRFGLAWESIEAVRQAAKDL